jgi:CheY-like chemotaxis protein
MPKEKLFIVEDEGVVALDLKGRLESLNYQVVGVEASATKAIRRVGKTHPDLVLMDIMLDGEFDGIQAADYIGRHYDIPVVFLTANSDPKTLERAKAAGPFGYLLKPFQERVLQTAIEMAIYRFSAGANRG